MMGSGKRRIQMYREGMAHPRPTNLYSWVRVRLRCVQPATSVGRAVGLALLVGWLAGNVVLKELREEVLWVGF